MFVCFHFNVTVYDFSLALDYIYQY